MVFNSFQYFIFFPIVVAVYFLTPRKYRWIVVLLGSYYFYLSWKPVYGFLLLATTLLDWTLALWMTRYSDKKMRKRILVLSIIANLAVLGFFKYFNFLSGSVWDLFGLHGDPVLLKIILPIGISFYTFQSLAYMIDVYRGDLGPERNFFRYAAFVSFFPHLVSGPILRPSSIIPQLREEKAWNPENVRIGLYLIATGLIKKVIIADRLGAFVETAYSAPASLSGGMLALATYCFAFQIYCDFAGYTDIAIGSAKILGYDILDNFRQPYFSKNIQEFWQRWHISLSNWLRDYLYIPLGGNRKGEFATYRNLMITMILGGLWHGASWTFVGWGLLQGILLCCSKLFDPIKIKIREKLKFPSWVFNVWSILITFHLVCFSWIFFRARSLFEARLIVRKILSGPWTIDYSIFSLQDLKLAAILIVCLVIFDIFESKKNILKFVSQLPWYYSLPLAYIAVVLLISLGVESGPQFIYFQF